MAVLNSRYGLVLPELTEDPGIFIVDDESFKSSLVEDFLRRHQYTPIEYGQAWRHPNPPVRYYTEFFNGNQNRLIVHEKYLPYGPRLELALHRFQRRILNDNVVKYPYVWGQRLL
jgi:hypothetical protein